MRKTQRSVADGRRPHPPARSMSQTEPILHADADRKGWRAYAGEFVMLFLAVSLGFVVDNYREYLSERDRERILMRQVVEDLRADKIKADTNLGRRAWRHAKMDSLLDLHEQGVAESRLSELYYLTQVVRNRYLFIPTRGAFGQLENAGGQQLITNQKVLRALQEYRTAVDDVEEMQKLEEDQIQRYRNGPLLRMFDPAVLRRITHQDVEDLDRRADRPTGPLRLIDTSPVTLNEFFTLALNMRSFNMTSTRMVTNLSRRAEQVANLVTAEYGFDD